jgi:hypothetical protein
MLVHAAHFGWLGGQERPQAGSLREPDPDFMTIRKKFAFALATLGFSMYRYFCPADCISGDWATPEERQRDFFFPPS